MYLIIILYQNQLYLINLNIFIIFNFILLILYIKSQNNHQ